MVGVFGDQDLGGDGTTTCLGISEMQMLLAPIGRGIETKQLGHATSSTGRLIAGLVSRGA
jgi:hypothetical protein